MQLVVFDLDDTLYLERDYVRSGFTAVGDHLLEQYRVEDAGSLLWRNFEAGVRGNAFNVAAQQLGFSESLIPELVEVYRHHRPQIQLLGDAVTALTVAQARAHTALVTDGYALGQRRKIEALGVEKYLETLVVTNEHGPGWPKPGVKAFQYLREHFGVAPDQCVYVGDNPKKDFRAPLALGWRTARIRREGGIYHEFALDEDDPTPQWDHFSAECVQYLLG